MSAAKRQLIVDMRAMLVRTMYEHGESDGFGFASFPQRTCRHCHQTSTVWESEDVPGDTDGTKTNNTHNPRHTKKCPLIKMLARADKVLA